MKLYEAEFTFTPDDESSGEGLITVSAESEEAAKSALLDLLGEVNNLVITRIREIVELPEGVDFTPRTLN